ncbi:MULTISPECIES: FMN-binding negative transcriptional regulator [Olivibacter]|jgi:transcriptional regulator|uniref:FMN-binding negative transcriptional regulator n=1 Tax=Olivibacter oleidegradans TaxID=760123 RepID=A0ABV6HPU4_9SPHI|nr:MULTISPECIES: FMN-binding negative transcriptional regulator [Olivibacter]QEL03595.1 FMN-binding negative transcriptional regulator [Olivibacter sp. LS-1]
MYIPKNFVFKHQDDLLEFIKANSFGLIINGNEQMVPVATHLPFAIEHQNGQLILKSHFAKANTQWKSIEEKSVLVVFSGPHAYISPKNYEKIESVPTWNYVAVHVYGTVSLIWEREEILRVLNATINFYDKDYNEQWKSLPKEYIDRMIKGIVAFKLEVSNIQGVKKLSQNKTRLEREKIINDLQSHSDLSDQQLAMYMRKEL